MNDMKESLVTGIKSKRGRLDRRKRDAMEQLMKGNYEMAASMAYECANLEGQINELEYQLEVLEVING